MTTSSIADWYSEQVGIMASADGKGYTAAQARRWKETIVDGLASDLEPIAAEHGVTVQHVGVLIEKLRRSIG